jgi:hypothetical protein
MSTDEYEGPIPTEPFGRTGPNLNRTVRRKAAKRTDPLWLHPAAAAPTHGNVREAQLDDSDGFDGSMMVICQDHPGKTFERACRTIKEHGHCNVPYSYSENSELATWPFQRWFQVAHTIWKEIHRPPCESRHWYGFEWAT